MSVVQRFATLLVSRFDLHLKCETEEEDMPSAESRHKCATRDDSDYKASGVSSASFDEQTQPVNTSVILPLVAAHH